MNLTKLQIELVKKLARHFDGSKTLTETEFGDITAKLGLGIDELIDALKYYSDIELCL